MPVLCFPNLDALRLAIASGIVLLEVARSPVHGVRDDSGQLWVEVSSGFPKDILSALTRIGVSVQGPGNAPLMRAFSQWAELLPLCPKQSPGSGPALIEVGDSELSRLTAELRRLGTPPLSIYLVPGTDQSWLLVERVPWLTALTGTDSDPPRITFFYQQSPRVWVLSGWEHPLGDHLFIPEGYTSLLRPGQNWQTVQDPFPRAETGADEFPGRGPVTLGDGSSPLPMPIGLSLRRVSDRDEPEMLWLLTRDPFHQLREMAQDTGERVLREFRIAVLKSSGGKSLICLLATNNTSRSLAPLPDCRGLIPHRAIPNLFLPNGYDLSPCVRPRTLARLMDISPDQIVWIEAGSRSSFTPHRVPRAAFRPMQEWLEYTTQQSKSLTAGWCSSGLLADPRFIVEPEQSRSGRNAARPEPKKTNAIPSGSVPVQGPKPEGWFGRITDRFFGGKSEPIRSPSRNPVPPAPPEPQPGGWVNEKLASPQALLRGNDWTVRKTVLEQKILKEFSRLSPPEQQQLWLDLGEVYTALGNSADAAICWLNAAWDSSPPPHWLLINWLKAEARASRTPKDGEDLEAILCSTAPVQAARVLAAYLTRAAYQPTPFTDLMQQLPRVLSLLNDHETDVPVRAVWLARKAVAQLTSGDVLTLARCRDRLFRRLTEKGPSLDLDVPSFLRFRGATANDRWLTVRDWLARVHDPIHRWLGRLTSPGRLQWAGIDPEFNCTGAYADLILAWGLSRLGDRARARDLETQADATLKRASGIGVDPAVHHILQAAFCDRIRGAEDGRPDRPGLPLIAVAELPRLDDLGRYAVDKLRAHCGILEPVDLVNPYRGRDLGGFLGSDQLSERLTRILVRPDLAPNRDEVGKLYGEITTDPTAATLPRVVFTLLEVGPRLDAEIAAAMVARAVRAVELIPEWLRLSASTLDTTSAIRRFGARLFTTASHAAGLFHLPEAFRQVADSVRSVAELPDSTAVKALELKAGLFFRTLRRLGITDLTADLLYALTRGGSPGPKELGMSVGWFAIDHEDAGLRILDAARDRLFLPGIADERERTVTALAYASAVGHAPPRIALSRLEELFLRLGSVITHGATNRYFTLKPLELIDTVVRSVVTDDFSLGPGVRGWLDDDEYLIRRRITRDLETVVE